MKTSEFTDKKVTELSRSYSDDFSDHDDDSDSSFRFSPLRPDVSSHFQNRLSVDYMDHMKVGSRWAGSSNDGGLISMIDRKMEEYTKNLLHAMEGLSIRLCQLENRTRKIEGSVDEMKDSSVFSHGRTEQKLKELENVLTKVQVGIRDLRDKQEISEVQIQLTKLQILKSHQKSEDQKAKPGSSSDQAKPSSTKAQSNESNPTHNLASQQQYPTHPIAHQTPSYQNLPAPIPSSSGQFPTQPLPQNQIPSVPSPIPVSDPTHRQYSMAPNQPPLATSSTTYQPYQPVQLQQSVSPYPSHGIVDPQARHSSPVPQLPLISQLQHPPNQPFPSNTAVDPQTSHFPTQNFGEIPYLPYQTYGAPGSAPPSQQVYFGPRSSEFLSGHTQPSKHPIFLDDYTRYGPSSQYSGPGLLSPELRPSSSSFSSNNRVSQLPKAKELPRALPMASEVDSGSVSGRTRNSVPVDDVIDSVVAMGFRRDLVRATVKKLSENGQSVDLNVVLDKLMKSGDTANESVRLNR